MNLNSAVANGLVTPRPSSPALLPGGEGRKLPLPLGEGWGEGERLIHTGFAAGFGCATEESRVNRSFARRKINCGRPGRQTGDFHWVHNIAIDSEGSVYTSEVDTGKRAQRFRRVR